MEQKKPMNKPVIPFGVMKAINDGKREKAPKTIGNYDFEVKGGLIMFIVATKRGHQFYALDFNKFDATIYKKIAN